MPKAVKISAMYPDILSNPLRNIALMLIAITHPLKNHHKTGHLPFCNYPFLKIRRIVSYSNTFLFFNYKLEKGEIPISVQASPLIPGLCSLAKKSKIGLKDKYGGRYEKYYSLAVPESLALHVHNWRWTVASNSICSIAGNPAVPFLRVPRCCTATSRDPESVEKSNRQTPFRRSDRLGSLYTAAHRN